MNNCKHDSPCKRHNNHSRKINYKFACTCEAVHSCKNDYKNDWNHCCSCNHGHHGFYDDPYHYDEYYGHHDEYGHDEYYGHHDDYGHDEHDGHHDNYEYDEHYDDYYDDYGHGEHHDYYGHDEQQEHDPAYEHANSPEHL